MSARSRVLSPAQGAAAAIRCRPARNAVLRRPSPGSAIQAGRPGPGFSIVRTPPRWPGEPVVQARLRIGRADDRFELEADAVADAVMAAGTVPAAVGDTHWPAPETIRRQPESPYSIDDGLLIDDQEEPASDGNQTLQAKENSGPRAPPASGLRAELGRLRGGGAPLPGPLREFMEPRFGRDFSRVRIHADQSAAQLADGINARAFAFGHDLAFASGQYEPGTVSGRRLIAHELAHVVQQGQAPALPAAGADHGTMERLQATDAGGEVIRRVKWVPNKETGKQSAPWGPGHPVGRMLEAATDAGSTLTIWAPNDGSTYWCHGYTFGGRGAKGGPYSFWGQDVPLVLKDDGWKPTYSCMAKKGDILVFSDPQGQVTHSGKIYQVVTNAAVVDDSKSLLESKWGYGAHNIKSWEENAKGYGTYQCYSKAPVTGVCAGKGANEG